MHRKLHYYFWVTYRRKILDNLLDENKNYYEGIVLDIGGRDRGRFRKPRDKVEKWIFSDIEEKHNPDIVLDVADMKEIRTGSINVINAIELFEHAENPELGLRECHRVLKKGGVMMMSVPFLFPIHADPYDYQRWTEDKWRKELRKIGYEVEKLEIMGRYFTVLADMVKTFIKLIPGILRYLSYLSYPLLDLVVGLDNTKFIKNRSRLGKFHGGYFMVLRK